MVELLEALEEVKAHILIPRILLFHCLLFSHCDCILLMLEVVERVLVHHDVELAVGGVGRLVFPLILSVLTEDIDNLPSVKGLPAFFRLRARHPDELLELLVLFFLQLHLPHLFRFRFFSFPPLIL